ncbi:MAG TPA: HEAT repeat domain-containing protein [Herpetosiphonaceae bacterium]
MSTRTQEVAGQPEEEPRRDTGKVETHQERPRVSQDRLRDLINALGDPNHPLHSQAVNDLVDIGEPAVSALSAALSPNYPWLTSYRAAEALAQIGDGRASGALINALRHPNSNVRWSVVRALSEVGDTRTLLALRRVVHEDHGKTSWGESVADTAQLALDRLQSRSALLRFSEPIKTALVFVAMLAVLAFAGNRVQALREQMNSTSGNIPVPVVSAGGDLAETTTAEPEESPTPEAATPTPSVVAGADDIVGTVKASGNVRNGPSREARRIGQVAVGDEVVFLAKSGTWYRIRLGEERAETSEITGGEGWVSEILVNVPAASVPPAETATP